MKVMKSLLVLGFCLVSLPRSSYGQAILSPWDAWSGMGSYSSQYLPVNVLNRSGLSASYTSLVTDFDSYVASTTTVSGGSSFNTWFSSSGVTTGNFDFDLGNEYSISAFSLWTDPQATADQGVKQFELFASNSSDFSVASLLGSYQALEGAGNATNFGQVFTFGTVSTRYVRMNILSNYGSTLTTGISEAAFKLAPPPVTVPEPASASLIAMATLGLLARYRRRSI